MQGHAGTQRLLLEQAVESLDQRPLALSSVARAVIRLTSDPDVGVAILARAIAVDPGLSIQIIRKSNSAFYAGVSKVTSLPFAILKIGFPATRSVAIASSVQGLYRMGDPEGLEQYLWRHSVAASIGTRLVCQHACPTLVEQGTLSGLLADIARLVLLQRFPAIYKPILIETRKHPEKTLEIELGCMGFTHSDLGAVILDRWVFDETEVWAVRCHHNPDQSVACIEDTDKQDAARSLAHAVCLADALTSLLEGPSVEPTEIDCASLPSVDHFDLALDDIQEIAVQMRSKVGDELQVFGESVPPL